MPWCPASGSQGDPDQRPEETCRGDLGGRFAFQHKHLATGAGSWSKVHVAARIASRNSRQCSRASRAAERNRSGTRYLEARPFASQP